MVTIDIAHDFSRFPGGRYRSDGPNSGERFRDDILEPALRSGDAITLVLDGVRGLPSSFLEEAFGGLVRKSWSCSDLTSRLHFVAASPQLKRYPGQILDYIRTASKVA